jgi:AraC family transcriptional regulator
MNPTDRPRHAAERTRRATPALFAEITAGRTGRVRSGPGLRVLESLHPARTALSEHSHDDVSIDVVVVGGLWERIGRRRLDRGPGSLLLKPAGLGHANEYGRTGARSLVLQCSVTSPLLGGWPGPSFGGPLLIDGAKATAFAHRLAALLRDAASGDPLALEESVVAGLEDLVEHRGSRRWRSSARRLARIRERLLDNLGRVPLGTLARDAGFTPSALTHAFRHRYGCTPSAMLRRYRLDRAIDLLERRDLRLSDIAVRCGFADQAHFTRDFRRLSGRSPGAYRCERLAGGRDPELNSVQDPGGAPA